MKKLIISIILLSIILLPLTTNALATNADDYEPLEIFVFTKDKCSSCDEVKTYLDDLSKGKINLKITYLNNKENKETLNKLQDELSIKKIKYPLIVVGSNYLIGYDEEKINETITEYQEHPNYCNLVTKIQNNEDLSSCLNSNKDIIKQVEYNEKDFPWFIVGVVVGFLVVVTIINVIRRKPKKVIV